MLISIQKCFKLFTFTLATTSSLSAFANTESNIPPKQLSSPVEHWQTYSQSGTKGTHTFTESKQDFKIEKLRSPSTTFRTGYAFINNGSLYFEDRGNNVSYKRNWLGIYNKSKISSDNTYRTSDNTFSYDSQSGVISACPSTGDGGCKEISFLPGTYPYVYAKKKNSVISITNYGEALLFKNDKWCRMSMHNDIYECKNSEPAMQSVPRAIQFYSSINYQGTILLGEWPTGRLYEFDGDKLSPSSMTPPKIAESADKRLGYEAQTMASYCGDLFVGYWPKGEVWRYDHTAGDWKFFKRFFSSVEEEPFIPHSYRDKDELNSAFFGQRITAMVPFKDALYVVTSNLNTWSTSVSIPPTVDQAKVAEYGAVHKIVKPGCTTSYARDLR